ncbi:MAG: LacI family DNA-binding transcriptional regulator [Brevinematia bacterium]
MTIEEIARISQTSKSTVSRVLNNLKGVKEEKRKKILKIIEDYGYKPNIVAKALSKKRTMHIGFILDDITNLFYRDILYGIESVLNPSGYNVIISNVYAEPLKRRKIMEEFSSGIVDGFIVMESDINEDEFLLNLSKRDVPFILIEDYIENSSIISILMDNVNIGFIATKHLIDLGHRRIAHITGNFNFKISRDRLAGYQKALYENSITLNEKYIIYGDYLFESGYNSAKKLLNLSSPPTAIFAANDIMAYGVIKYAKEIKVRIPDDLSIVGVDALKLPNEDNIAITSIKQPTAKLVKKPPPYY